MRVPSGELQAPWTGKALSKPVITVTDEAGNKADVTLYNIWAGKVSCTCAARCSHNMSLVWELMTILWRGAPYGQLCVHAGATAMYLCRISCSGCSADNQSGAKVVGHRACFRPLQH